MRVAVLGGGRSSEHEVSLESAASVRAGLVEAGHEPVEVLIERDGRWTHEGEALALEPSGGLLGADAVFPVLHGPFGEDGTVQGLLDLLDVPYVGAGMLSSSLSMDKALFKDLMAAHGVPQGDYAVARFGEAPPAFGPPAFVKPARLGSSVGISKAVSEVELDQALALAFEHDPVVVIERLVVGMEVECSVLGNGDPQASTPGEIVVEGPRLVRLRGEVHRRRHGAGRARPHPLVEDVRRLAVEVFKIVGCSGMARVDFFVTEDGVLVNELNTIPGFTATSVYAKLWEASGVDYPELLDRLLALALERHADEREDTGTSATS